MKITPRYRQYLESPKWAMLRDAVLKRDKYLCQGCLKSRATQAHHLTYKHIFHELAFELIAVCPDCHEKLHGPELAKVEDSLPYGQHLIAALDHHADARGKTLMETDPKRIAIQEKVREWEEECERMDKGSCLPL